MKLAAVHWNMTIAAMDLPVSMPFCCAVMQKLGKQLGRIFLRKQVRVRRQWEGFLL